MVTILTFNGFPASVSPVELDADDWMILTGPALVNFPTFFV